MWFSRVNYARGKGGNVGKSFSPFLYFSHDNLKLVGNIGNIGKHFSQFLYLSHDILKLAGNMGNIIVRHLRICSSPVQTRISTPHR